MEMKDKKEQILAEVRTEIHKHEVQADSDRRSIQELNGIIESQRREALLRIQSSSPAHSVATLSQTHPRFCQLHLCFHFVWLYGSLFISTARDNTEEESATFFASTPPLEAVKFLVSEAMTKRVSRNNRPLRLSFIDEKKAHLCSDVLRELYVEPPPEANEPPDIVWRLQRALYGTRDAAAAWEREWTKTLNSVGFKSGVSNPALLHCETHDGSMVVHGDYRKNAIFTTVHSGARRTSEPETRLSIS